MQTNITTKPTEIQSTVNTQAWNTHKN